MAMSLGEGLEEELSLRMSLTENSLADDMLFSGGPLAEEEMGHFMGEDIALKPLSPSPSGLSRATSSSAAKETTQSAVSPNRNRGKNVLTNVASSANLRVVQKFGVEKTSKQMSSSSKEADTPVEAGKENAHVEVLVVSEEELFRFTKELVLKQGKDNAMTVKQLRKLLEKKLGVSLKKRKETILRAVHEAVQEWSQLEALKENSSNSKENPLETEASASEEEKEIVVKKKKGKKRAPKKQQKQHNSDSDSLVRSEEEEGSEPMSKRNKKRTRGGKQKKGDKGKDKAKGKKSSNQNQAAEQVEDDVDLATLATKESGSEAGSDVDVQMARAMEGSDNEGEQVAQEGGRRLGRLKSKRQRERRVGASKKTLDATQMTALQRLKALRQGKLSKNDFLQVLEQEDSQRQAKEQEELRVQEARRGEQQAEKEKKRRVRKAARREEKKKLKEKKRAEKNARKEKRRADKLAGKVGKDDDSELSSSDYTDEGLEAQDDLSDGEAFEEDDEEFVPGQKKKKKKKKVLTLQQMGTLEGDRRGGFKSKSRGFKSGQQAAPQTPLHVVDRYAGLDELFEVYSHGGHLQAFMLNHVDLTFGKKGHNKYYMGQVCEREDMQQYIVFFKWARVGAPNPQSQSLTFNKASLAMDCLHKKFYDKTRNTWASHTSNMFSPVPGKYTAMDVEGGKGQAVAGAADAWLEDEQPGQQTQSGAGEGVGEAGDSVGARGEQEAALALGDQVRALVRMICGRSMLQRALNACSVDINSYPLGKLSRKQLTKGYDVLKQVADCLLGFRQGVSGSHRYKNLTDLSNKFYTLIPHNFGMQLPPVVESLKMLQEKIHLLESLSDVQRANGLMIKAHRETLKGHNPLLMHYQMLRSDIKFLPETSPVQAQIQAAVKGTHAPTHDSFRLEVEAVFRVEREGEAYSFAPFAALPERRLLWHGSRMTNAVGILSQGLRVAPPEAPKTGYMFGKGLYFADCASKSANYCHATREQPYGLLVLGEVALGSTYDVTKSEYMAQAPRGFHSTRGLGRHAPLEGGNVTLEDGCELMTGPLGMDNGHEDSTLLYNEYVVYDTNQVRIRYLVKVKFEFHDSMDMEEDDFAASPRNQAGGYSVGAVPTEEAAFDAAVASMVD